MRFFFDNNIALRIARAMHQLVHPTHEAAHLREKFDRATPDTEWITTLAEEGDWIIISGDLNISKRPQEKRVLRAARLTTFFLAQGFVNVPFWEQVKWVIHKWPLIVDQAQKIEPGACFVVPKTGARLKQL